MDSLYKAHTALDAFKSADKDRYDFIEDVLEQMRTVLSEKAKIEEKLEDLERVRDSYRQDLNSTKAELNDLKISTARNSFVLVLVDGDAAPFRDDFIRRGTSGGESAAQELLQKVIDYVTGCLSVTFDEIVIQVYSKMHYLNRTYCRAGILQGENSLQTFVQGFNRVRPLCEYVDAGNDKEGADRKVQNMMELFMNNVHCKHIILCASQDDSYTGFLRQFVRNGKVFDGITLVEAIPFPQFLADLSSNFLTTKFPDVFRDTKLPERGLVEDGHIGRFHTAQDATYAGAVSRAASSASAMNRVLTIGIGNATQAQSPPAILVNAADQRVDSKLPQHDAKIVGMLKERKLCKRHFLSHCVYSSGECIYNHDAELKAAELVALQFVARLSPCENGIFCKDANCVSAHMCKYGTKCKDIKICRYPKAMHNLDPQPVRSISAWP